MAKTNVIYGGKGEILGYVNDMGDKSFVRDANGKYAGQSSASQRITRDANGVPVSLNTADPNLLLKR
jgi:hypothetical protein